MREQFRAAYAAANTGVVADDDPALRAYVLYPYLRAARIEQALGLAEGSWHDSDVAAAEFLKETGDDARRTGTPPHLACEPRAPRVVGSVYRSLRSLRGHACARVPAVQRAYRARGDRGPRSCDPCSLAHGQSIAERMRACIPVAECAARAPRRARRQARRAPARQWQRIVRPHDRRAAPGRRGRAAARARRLHREPGPDARCAARRPESARARRGRARGLVAACAQCAGRSAPTVHSLERTHADARGRG